MDIIFSVIFEDLIQKGLDRIFDWFVPTTMPYRRAIYVLYMVVAVLLLLGSFCAAAFFIFMLIP